jgi:hypothetical protein
MPPAFVFVAIIDVKTNVRNNDLAAVIYKLRTPGVQCIHSKKCPIGRKFTLKEGHLVYSFLMNFTFSFTRNTSHL